MPAKKEITAETMRKAEREIGHNIPETLVGKDNGDVRALVRHEGETEA